MFDSGDWWWLILVTIIILELGRFLLRKRGQPSKPSEEKNWQAWLFAFFLAGLIPDILFRAPLIFVLPFDKTIVTAAVIAPIGLFVIVFRGKLSPIRDPITTEHVVLSSLVIVTESFWPVILVRFLIFPIELLIVFLVVGLVKIRESYEWGYLNLLRNSYLAETLSIVVLIPLGRGIVFRGPLLLLDEYGTGVIVIAGVLLSALSTFYLWLRRDHYFGVDGLGSYTLNFLCCLLLCTATVISESLWYAIGLHAAFTAWGEYSLMWKTK